MPMHRLTSITMGVPNVRETAEYYLDFGSDPRQGRDVLGLRRRALAEAAEHRFSTRRRRGAAAHRPVAAPHGSCSSASASRTPTTSAGSPRSCSGSTWPFNARRDVGVSEDPGTEVRVVVEIAARVDAATHALAGPTNTPGQSERLNERAPGALREQGFTRASSGTWSSAPPTRRPARRFFTEGLGFKVSDTVPFLASFMRCSTDHHNVLVQQAPVSYLHHTSWQVDDVDEIGRGATAMLAKDPDRHVWGLGRHFVGSNYFWYLKRPGRQLLRVLQRHRLHRR